jgi:mycothiol synthase
LLSWSEERSKAALGLVSAEFRVAPHTGTEHHNLAGIETIRKLGWTHVRSYYRMEVKLETQPQVPPIPAGIVIRPYDPETETEAVYNTFVDSFKDHYGFVAQPFEHGFANFKHNMIDEPGYDPNFWFVAVDGDTIAGICICRPVSTEDPEGGWVSELGVRRGWRKKGLGTLLLKTAFAAFYERGQKRASLGVDASSLTGALRLYEQAGMNVSRQYDKFEKELRPGQELATQELA